MVSQGGAVEEPKLQSLAREGSLYSLTLDEVRNQLGDLGKPLGSMNLDELLKSVWSAEADQPTAIALNNASTPQLASCPALHRQGSLTLSRDLSKKTVDEVWRDIQQTKEKSNQERQAQQRQPTLGEMTLEDFLVKAGVVTEPTPALNNAPPSIGVDSVVGPQQNIPHHPQWVEYQLPSVQQPQQQHQHQRQQNMMAIAPGQPLHQPLPVSVNPIMDASYPETQVVMSPSSLIGTLSDTQTPGRKRVAPGDVAEKNVERRQKRMIKNRESAARSRARKQAYTHELENKVLRLEEENERLRREKELEKILPCAAPPPEPKYQLRRTSSASF